MKKLLWILVLPLLMASCEEDQIIDPIQGCLDELASNFNGDAEVEGECVYDAAAVLEDHYWYIESATGMLGENPLDLLLLEDYIPACTHDNLFLFGESGEVTMHDYIDECGEGEESVLDITGVWTVENDTLLQIVQDDNVYELVLTNVSPNSMDLNFEYDLNGMLIPATIVLVKSDVQVGDFEEEELDATLVLEANAWLVDALTADLNGNEINLMEIEGVIPECTLDNLFFFEGGEVTMDDNEVLCEQGEVPPIDITGVWSVDGDILTVENETETVELQIVNLSSTTIELQTEYYYTDMDMLIPAVIRLIAN